MDSVILRERKGLRGLWVALGLALAALGSALAMGAVLLVVKGEPIAGNDGWGVYFATGLGVIWAGITIFLGAIRYRIVVESGRIRQRVLFRGERVFPLSHLAACEASWNGMRLKFDASDEDRTILLFRWMENYEAAVESLRAHCPPAPTSESVSLNEPGSSFTD